MSQKELDLILRNGNVKIGRGILRVMINELIDVYDFEKIGEYFEKNKDNVYFFSVESLETIDDNDIPHFVFQYALNKYITKDEFILAENMIIALLEYLYIKSDSSYCLASTHFDVPLKKIHYVKKSKEVKTFLNYVSDNIGMCIEIKDINALRGFSIIGIREIGNVCFCFENPEMAVMIEECQGVIYFKDIDNAKEFLDVAKRIGLNTEKWNI